MVSRTVVEPPAAAGSAAKAATATGPAGGASSPTAPSGLTGGAVSSATQPPAPAAPPLLRVRGLRVAYGATPVLDHVDLDIQPGEIVALAGANGAGKSTLVRAIAGEIAFAGSVEVAGAFVAGTRRNGRRRSSPIGRRAAPTARRTARRAGRRNPVEVIWQDLALVDELDIAANLLLGAEPRWIVSDIRAHAVAARTLSELGIPLPPTTHLAGALSGGQRQLLALARAMRLRPKLLILDEPTAALDVNSTAQVESLTARFRRQYGTTVLFISHDVEQIFRIADRILVLNSGRLVAEIDPRDSHPDELAAVMSGQRPDASARRQLSRLQLLADRLANADAAAGISLILAALADALPTEQVCLHVLDGDTLTLAGSIGLAPELAAGWRTLPLGAAGGPVGRAAAEHRTVIAADIRTSDAWASAVPLAHVAQAGGSWSVPMYGTAGVLGVVTVLRRARGGPVRDEIDMVNLYAGYAAGTVERERLLDQLTTRNRVLETIREVLQQLAGPLPVGDGVRRAVETLRAGIGAVDVELLTGDAARVHVGTPGDDPTGVSARFDSPIGTATLVARWADRASIPADADAVLADAAHSLRLALERESADAVRQEAAALRRSRELQRLFLSRLSHELRTPLTAIRGYADSLLAPDVEWSNDARDRFVTTIGAESSRLTRLVEDLLDFSAIESGTLRLQRDWCELPLVVDAARACLAPDAAAAVSLDAPAGLPPVWADHDRLEQVFVNLMDNAIRHNPPGTTVTVTLTRTAGGGAPAPVAVRVRDDGDGLAAEVAAAPFEPGRRGRSARAGSGLGLSIAKGIVDAHGGTMAVEPAERGTCFAFALPTEHPATVEASEPTEATEATDGGESGV